MEILVDTRERALHQIISRVATLEYPNVKVTIREIQVGDYAIVYNDHLLALFERKTWADLRSTFTDASRKKNYLKMLEAKKTAPHLRTISYILEGKVGKKPTARVGGGRYGVNVGRLKAHVDHLTIRHNIVQFHTKDPEGTARRVLEMAHAFGTCKEIIAPLSKEGGASDRLSKRREKTPEQVTSMLWASVGLSANMVDMLRAENSSLRDFLLSPPTEAELAILKYPSGMSVGKKRAQTALQRVRKLSTAKFVCAIPWVSDPISRLIESSIGLQDLLENGAEGRVANLKREKTGRRLGEKIEQRVCSALKNL